MKVSVQHLGIIEGAEFDLKPLTVLVGENNTNKTWTAYATYGLLRGLVGQSNQLRISPRIHDGGLMAKIEEVAGDMASKIEQTIDVTSFSTSISRASLIENMEPEVTLSLSGAQIAKILAAPESLTKRTGAQLALTRAEVERGAPYFHLSVDVGGKSYLYGEAALPPGPEFTWGDGFLAKETFSRWQFSKLSRVYSTAQERNWKAVLQQLLKDFVLASLGEVVPLPAERKALVELLSALPITPSISLPLPVLHFLSLMRNAQSEAAEESESRRENDVEKYLTQLMGGAVRFAGKAEVKALNFYPADDVVLPIQAASSLVRSLSGLSLIASRARGKRNVFVIDEPEMNAHPAAQIALIEILSLLANGGNYVLLTTHSPYVVQHVNNLLMAGDLRNRIAKKKASSLFWLKSDKAFLSSEDVAAYEIGHDGTMRNLMLPDRRRLDSSTFGNVSSVLENLYSELLDLSFKRRK